MKINLWKMWPNSSRNWIILIRVKFSSKTGLSIMAYLLLWNALNLSKNLRPLRREKNPSITRVTHPKTINNCTGLTCRYEDQTRKVSILFALRISQNKDENLASKTMSALCHRFWQITSFFVEKVVSERMKNWNFLFLC